ncbi:MAG: 4-hydroxy-tetrahydrodipicolinate reductase [Fimbriimonadaceae bacterium]|nr:4-hydroxy-tetrahydrodipicolinate reductase [Fimbriimonadaceae bacterium]
MSAVRVAIAGVAGRMGREVARSLSGSKEFEVVVAVDRAAGGTSLRELVGPSAPDLVVAERLGEALDAVPCDVLVEFTHPSAAFDHAESALRRGVAPVVGTSGLDDASLRELALMCEETGTPAMVVPNFALGAVLMMRFAEMAARWMPHCEVIEMHHDRKADAPSGTAQLTASRIAAARKTAPALREELLHVEGARGGTVQGVPVHSVRLPGLVAHQLVVFGGQGETLTLRHDSLDRSSFMEGVALCVRRVRSLHGLVIGLDTLLD